MTEAILYFLLYFSVLILLNYQFITRFSVGVIEEHPFSKYIYFMDPIISYLVMI